MRVLVLAMLAGCSPEPRLAILPVPASAKTLVTAGIEVGLLARPVVIDLADPPALPIQRELGPAELVLTVFYDRSPAEMLLAPGPLSPTSHAFSRALPATNLPSFVIDGGDLEWRETALPPAVPAFRFENDHCRDITADAAPLLTGGSMPVLLPLAGGRVLVGQYTHDRNVQIAIATATSAVMRPDLALPAGPSAGLVDGDTILLATADGIELALWRGTIDRGFERVATSTVEPHDHVIFMALDRDRTPPVLYARTIYSRVLEIDARGFRELFRGNGIDKFSGGAVHVPGEGVYVDAKLADLDEVVLRVQNGAVRTVEVPQSGAIDGFGFANGQLWIAIDNTGLWRRGPTGWVSHPNPGLALMRTIADLGDSALFGTHGGLVAQLIPELGYCPPVRFGGPGLIVRLATSGDELWVAREIGQTNELWHASIVRP